MLKTASAFAELNYQSTPPLDCEMSAADKHLHIWKWVFRAHAIAVALLAIVILVLTFFDGKMEMLLLVVLGCVLALPAAILWAIGARFHDCQKDLRNRSSATIVWASNVFAAMFLLSLIGAVCTTFFVSSFIMAGAGAWVALLILPAAACTVATSWSHSRIHAAERALLRQSNPETRQPLP